jgi:hypothetical protein
VHSRPSTLGPLTVILHSTDIDVNIGVMPSESRPGSDIGATTDDLIQAFRLIDGRLSGDGGRGPLAVLRERLLGELVGDADRVAATLSPDFVLVSHGGGASTTTAGPRMVESIRRQGAAGMLMWVELDELLVEDDAVAGQGVLRTMRAAGGGADGVALTTDPLALFLRFAGDLMTSEVVFLDTAAGGSTTVHGVALPSREHLLARAGDPPRSP